MTFSRNTVVFRLRATDSMGNPYGPAGASAQVTMNNLGLLVNNTLRINWTEPGGAFRSVIFTAKASPTLETHVQSQPSGLTDFVYFQTVAAQIQANSAISPFFTVWASSPSAGLYRINIQANDPDPDWEITFTITGIDAGSNPTTSSDAAVADNTPDNYKIIFDVFFEDEYNSGTFLRSASLEGTPDDDGYLLFNIESVLHNQARNSQATLPVPALDNDGPIIADIIRRYYVRYRQDYTGIFDDPLNTDGAWNYFSISKVLIGGVSQKLFASYDFFDELDADNSLLTWYPDGKNISPGQPEYLAWYNYTGSSKSIVLELKRQTATGFDTTLYIYDFDPVPTASEQVLLIPCSLSLMETLLSLDFSATKKYTVRVVDAASDWEGASPSYLSQPRSFYVDRSHYEEEKYLVYLNSFSCPEVLRCTGVFSRDLNVESEQVQRILPYNYERYFSELYQYDQTWRNQLTYRSGYVSKGEALALQELLIYRKAWEIQSDGYAGLLIQGKNFKITETLRYLHFIEFTAVRALEPKNYSGNVLVPATNFWELEDIEDLWFLETVDGFFQLETT